MNIKGGLIGCSVSTVPMSERVRDRFFRARRAMHDGGSLSRREIKDLESARVMRIFDGGAMGGGSTFSRDPDETENGE